MKTLLICPAERPTVTLLAESTPLAALSFFGKALICYWIEHLASQKVTDITILAADRPEIIRDVVGDGCRWGVKIDVMPETRELTPQEARAKYLSNASTENQPQADVIVVDRLPGMTENDLFASYAELFLAAQKFFPEAQQGQRIGLREIKPGVWAGLRARIAPSAKLIAPCWISDHVCIADDAVVGPWAILENRVLVDEGASVSNSIVGTETFVGRLITVKNSVVMGNTLINCQNDSYVKIIDPFLLSSLKTTSGLSLANGVGRVAALAAMIATSPLAVAWVLAVKLRGQPVLQWRTAVSQQNREPIDYCEFTNTGGFWKRWPQLWNVFCGNFAWIGNRPLNVHQAAELKSEFERLWLSVPVGLISLADIVGCPEGFSDEARAHAAFYASQRSWSLDFSILGAVLKRLCLPRKSARLIPQRPAETALLGVPNTPLAQPIPASPELPMRVEGIADWRGGN